MTYPPRSRRVLVAGCGWLGTALGLELVERGHEVFGLRRDVSALPPSLRPVAADLGDAASRAGLPGELDACVYCAAASGPGVEAYRAAYVRGLANLLGALSGRPRLVFTSSTGVYGQDAGEEVDERSPTEPARPTGRVLLEAEELARASGLSSVVTRLSGLYGPGRDRLVRSVRDGTARLPSGPTWTNRIHRDDAAGFLAHVLAADDPAPLYVVSDDEPADRAEVLRWLAARLGVDEPPRDDRPAPGRNKRCVNALLRASGYRLRHPTFREGYAALLGAGGA